MKRLAAASVAAATTLTLVAAPAQAQTAPNNELEGARQGVEALKLVGILADKGLGAVPNTKPAGEMMFGSVQQGSSAEEAYNGSQAAWALTWIAVSAAGLGLIAFGLDKAGVLPPSIAANLPF